MTPKQLESRNKRRQRNRECAQRARDRKVNHVNELESKVKNLEGEKKFTNTFHKNKLANVSAKLHGMKWKMKAKVKSLERKILENKSKDAVGQKSQDFHTSEKSSALFQRNEFKKCSIREPIIKKFGL